MSKTRETSITTVKGKYPDLTFFGTPFLYGSQYEFSVSGIEEVIGSGHPWRSTKRSMPLMDVGGDFSVRRVSVTLIPGLASCDFANGAIGYRATDFKVVPARANLRRANPGDLPGLLSPFELIQKGTEGWNKFKPTKPNGQLDQFVGELHDLPSVPRIRDLWDTSKRMKDSLPKRFSKEYLNIQFGWLPFLSDIHDVIVNVQRMETRLRQLYRDNGRPVRRKGRFSHTSSVDQSKRTSHPGGLTYPATNSDLYDKPEEEEHELYESKDFQFSGRFRYYLQDPTKVLAPSREKYQLNRILFGAEINAATLYHLMPWSWLIDWVSSTGSVVDNLVNDSVDNLVADYAYVTGRKTLGERYVVKGGLKGGSPYATTYGVEYDVKCRTHATPYGFGFSIPDLSLKQKAILVALGLTRLT